jgi:hypothetical protein
MMLVARGNVFESLFICACADDLRSHNTMDPDSM